MYFGPNSPQQITVAAKLQNTAKLYSCVTFFSLACYSKRTDAHAHAAGVQKFTREFEKTIRDLLNYYLKTSDSDYQEEI